MMTKSQIRSYITEQKKRMTHTEIETLSDGLADRFLALPQFLEADCLFAYLSFNQEVRTARIIGQAVAMGKRVAVPKVTGPDLEFRYINSVHECTPGSLGIQEPGDHHESADGKHEKILMLMPGLAFDPTGARVGYGKGLYDRYLDRHASVDFFKIALCYDFQILDHIETDSFDQRADIVISNSQFFITAQNHEIH